MDLRANKIDVFVPCGLKNKTQNNKLWEWYITDRFGQYKDFAKQWIASFVFFSEYQYKNKSKNKRLPIMILTGERTKGKTSFIELISKIYSEHSYAKISKENFQSRFDNWKSNKLVHINESSKMNHEQYEKLKNTMGSDLVAIEKKGKDIIHQKNNISMVIDSNKKNPIYTVISEMPEDESENQFFVCKFNDIVKNDKVLEDLEQSFYHYADTVLRQVFETEVIPNINVNRWIIETPITEECKNMFLINRTNLDYFIEEITTLLKTEYLDHGKTFISNTSIDEISEKIKAKSSNYLKNDLIEHGLIYPESKTNRDRVNGKVVRGYFINAITVNKLYGSDSNITNISDVNFIDEGDINHSNIFTLSK